MVRPGHDMKCGGVRARGIMLHALSCYLGLLHASEGSASEYGDDPTPSSFRVSTIDRLHIHMTSKANIHVTQQAVFKAVHPAMHRQLLPARPGILNDGALADLLRLMDDVKLAQTIDLLIEI